MGRDPTNDYVVPTASFPGVSSRHARLFFEEDVLWVEDAGSKNGTLVNGEPVDRAPLRNGDVFELGPDGPRFAAMTASGLDETMDVARMDKPRHKFGTQTMAIVREDLGIPEAGVDAVLKKRSRNTVLLATIMGALVVGLAWLGWEFVRTERMELRAEQQAALAEQQQRFDEQRSQWESDRSALAAERAEIEAAIARLETDGLAVADERLDDLREQLVATNKTLELYNPVNLEKNKLDRVSKIEEAVVLIEAVQRFREKTTGRLLYSEPSEDPRVTTVNFQDLGEPFETGATGSGFCVDDGYIITNAHVVLKKGDTMALDLGPGIDLTSEVTLNVIFSGDSRRHPAQLLKFEAQGDEDLALLKIESFEGMPRLPSLDVAVASPPRGTEVFLLGFPLGKAAMQQGDTMLASTFRGIVSRKVGAFLQVDAAVHPGNSGGPVIDGEGKVLGVVTGMQVVGPNQGSSAIGYVIPVEDFDNVWPPDAGP